MLWKAAAAAIADAGAPEGTPCIGSSFFHRDAAKTTVRPARTGRKECKTLKRRRLVLVVPLSILLLVALILYLTKSSSPGSLTTQSIRINEVMTSNKGTVPDETGDFPDWVELYNDSDQALEIGGYGLSDDKVVAAKWTFPAGTTIEPHGYLIVFCSGDPDRGSLHTTFKLSADDDLVLTSEGGAVVDSLSLKSVSSGYSLGRDDGGNWVEMRPSPGYPNTDEGVAAFLATLSATDAESIGVYLNEFMASNASTLLGPDGSYCDWIELYNTNGNDVDLSGYGISDNPAQPLKYVLPEGTVIRAYSTLLIYCTGREGTSNTQIEAPFGLAAYEEAVVFSTPDGRILDNYEYTRQETDKSMARMPDGTGAWQQTASPTPGYTNTSAGAAEYQASLPYGTGELMISEICNCNKSVLMHTDQQYYDWIEIYNRSGAAISLAGYALSDNAKNPAKWVFPEVTLGAGEYLVVLASGNNVTDTSRTLETNFGISADGDTVFLFAPDATLLDKLQIAQAHVDVSCGRGLDGKAAYYEMPTPGQPNGTGASGYAETPAFSLPTGAYTSTQSVEISIPIGTTVRYTTDGSTPTESSPAYTGPIALSSGVTVLRARAFGSGLLTSDVATASYFINLGEATAENHVSTLPVVSLVSDPDYLFGATNGIYVAGQAYNEKSGGMDAATSYTIKDKSDNRYFRYTNFFADLKSHPDPMNMEWERPAHIDYIGADGALLFEEDVLCRIFGAYSRFETLKGIALVSRAGYGSTSMDYAFFDNRDYTSFKSLTLRASAMDSIYTRIRDILIQGLLEDGGSILPTQAYVQVVLYINGEYWGVYNLREKVNKYFLAQRYGLADPEKIDILVGNGVSLTAEDGAGNSDSGYLDYKALVEYAGSHDLSDASNYAYVCSLMDVENFAEYCAMEIYVGNTDTGNIKFWRSEQLDNKWRWIPYDFDWAFNREDGSTSIAYTTGYRRDFFTKYLHPDGHGAGKGFSTVLVRALLQNSSFRALFLEKCALMLQIFDTDTMIARIDELSANIKEEMAYDTAKWGVIRFVTWETRVEGLRESAKNAPEYFLYYAQQYFGLSDAEMTEIFGRRSSLTGVS